MALGMNDFRSIVIKADAANTSIAPIRLSQNDQDGRRIVFELWDGAESIAATGLTARLLFGVGEGGYATMSAVSGAATATWAVDVPQEALQTAGVVRMAVEVSSGAQAVCTRIFDAVVEPALIDESSPEAQDALSEFREAVARLEDFTVPVPASNGGTGRTTLTSNAVLAGNGTGQVKQIATASGALYATAANGAAQFGALPVAQGGTGSTSAADARTALGVGNSRVNSVQLGGTNSGRQKAEFVMKDQNMCALVIKRSTHTMAIVMVDLWSTNLAVWGTLPEELHFIRGAASGQTNKFTIQNNISIGSSAVVIIGIGCTIGEVSTSESAIAENFTRSQMDGAEKCVEIASNASTTVDFKGNTALVYGMRGATKYAALVDYWGTEPTAFLSASAVPTVTKTANSNSMTITNNHSYAMQFTVVSLAPNV